MSQSGGPFDPYYQWLGIPPEEQPPNHYRLLGLRLFEDNSSVIQTAADRQMVHLRTFQTGPRATISQKVLNEVSTARVCLLSAEKKAAYDAQLRATFAVPPAPLPPQPPAASPASAPQAETWQSQTAALPKPSARRRATARRRKSPAPLISVVLLLTAAAIAAGWYFFVFEPSRHAYLTLKWPQAERSQAQLQIDGRTWDWALDVVQQNDEEIVLRSEPGAHQVQIERTGYRPIAESVELEAGITTDLVVTFVKEQGLGFLTLRWPEANRSGVELELNGELCDWASRAASQDEEEIRIPLATGEYTLRMKRAEQIVLERVFTIKPGKLVSVATLPTLGRLVLRWPEAYREGATLQLDGQAVDLAGSDVIARPESIELTLPQDEHTVHVVLPDGRIIDQKCEILATRRTEVDIAKKISEPIRVVLQWPVAERQDAVLDVDAQPVALTADNVRSDDQQVTIELPAGEHTIKIVRPDGSVFQTRVDGTQPQAKLAVTWGEPPSTAPGAEQLQTLLEEFRTEYKTWEEYTAWDSEKGAEKKRDLGRVWLAKMESEGADLDAKSAKQFAYYDEVIHRAVELEEFVQAHAALTGAVGAELFAGADRQERADLIWNGALKATQLDDLLDFLRASRSSGRKLTEQEQTTVAARITDSPQITTDFATLGDRVQELQQADVLSAGTACTTLVALYVKAAEAAPETTTRLGLDLGERMLALAPLVLESDLPDAGARIGELIQALNLLRRKSFKDVGPDDAARGRLDKLAEGLKQLREWDAQFANVRAARKAIADGQGSPAEQKLVGLWLLQMGRFVEALPFLQAADDPGLFAISGALPTTGKELVARADLVESESKKRTYSRRQEEALHALARYLREAALKTTDDSLPPAERDALQKKLSAADSERRELDNRRFPRGEWRDVTDLLSVDEFRERVEQVEGGQWKLREDGAIVTAGKAPARLDLPVILDGSYSVRFACLRTAPGDVVVHLPVADSSAIFTLGAPTRTSGLQLVDGKKADDAANPTRIQRTELTVAAGKPMAVEIHVEVERVDMQSPKRRKQTEGKDWVTINITVRGDKAPVTRTISLAATAFTPPKPNDAAVVSVGLTAPPSATLFALQLMRR
jgi:hypothetical protein